MVISTEPVLIVRPDDGLIGPKHVALYVLLMLITDVLGGNRNTVFKICVFFSGSMSPR